VKFFRRNINYKTKIIERTVHKENRCLNCTLKLYRPTKKKVPCAGDLTRLVLCILAAEFESDVRIAPSRQFFLNLKNRRKFRKNRRSRVIRLRFLKKKLPKSYFNVFSDIINPNPT